MNSSFIQSEAFLRRRFFLGIFLCMALWQRLSPGWPLTPSRSARWLNNSASWPSITLLVRLLFPAAAVGVAVYAGQRGWGLLRLAALTL